VLSEASSGVRGILYEAEAALLPGPASHRRDGTTSRQRIGAMKKGPGDPPGFRSLYATYYPLVLGFFRRRVRSVDDCLDLTQDSFLRVFKGMEGYRGDAPIGAWIFSIARNVYRQYVAGRPPPGGDDPGTGGPGEDDEAAERRLARFVYEDDALERLIQIGLRRLLREAIRRLPPQRRRCVILLIDRELSYEEIAKVMRLSIGTVKAHLAQAREQLRELLEEHR
jgi:RNA polymerase sigma-70 factor (ECF subfamily)